ncbi:guanine nucleotide-binding protein alpha-2 subunit [Penicillium antarcticum]|uniref:guanine nucleotide-binding protein alpha-2 subunit n=1 Tax=Penicillium antarcticum TaxID=416450 RepID=UPI00239DE31C|nr:guanine nucleotide-binding protein alpha-2 subunit [Penicillium antarcticum]KAJ5302299.1 guanine nucleotide-binding protein alpha-2 subunit [Penicillium antarcticum]
MFFKKSVARWMGPNNVDDEASRHNSHIEGLLKSERKAARKTTTVLLLGQLMERIADRSRASGPDNSGKSTIFEKMRMMSLDDFSKHERQGILLPQSPTDGATDIFFTLSDTNWRMVDLGGQSLKRKKWMRCLEDVDYLMFVVALSTYDQCLDEGHCTNQMREAMKLFDSFVNSDIFKNKPILLILDKLEIFEEKLYYSPISGHFPDFNASDTTSWAAAEYIGHLFQQINRTQGREIYVHYMNTTDTNSLKLTMALMYRMVMAQKLRTQGLPDSYEVARSA